MTTNAANPKNFDEYFAAYPPEVREMLEKIRTTIQQAAPDAEEAIKYQIPTFMLKGMLVSFAAYKKHIGFYPGAAAIETFKDELSAYQWAKGSVQFPLTQPIPYGLISRITKFRVEQNQKKAASKAKKNPGGVSS